MNTIYNQSFCRRVSATVAAAFLFAAVGVAQGGWLEKGRELLDDLAGERSAGAGLSVSEIASGLKEALRVGTERVVGQLGQAGGFNADPAVHIPLPESLDTVKSALSKIGMDSMLTDLETKLNRAAEVATPKAKAVFWGAIGEMTLADAQSIYQGPDDAATQYFRAKMSAPLAEEMRPVITDSLSEVGAIAAYDKVMAQYEDLPFMPDVKANLTEHVVWGGIDGIFYYLAGEEAAIREDPAARTTALLKKVFGRAE